MPYDEKYPEKYTALRAWLEKELFEPAEKQYEGVNLTPSIERIQAESSRGFMSPEEIAERELSLSGMDIKEAAKRRLLGQRMELTRQEKLLQREKAAYERWKRLQEAQEPSTWEEYAGYGLAGAGIGAMIGSAGGPGTAAIGAGIGAAAGMGVKGAVDLWEALF